MTKTNGARKVSLARAARKIRSFKTFVSAAATDFQSIASVAPSSRRLACAMLEGLPIENARTVVELGAGTGAITRVLLERLPHHATLLAFEINTELIQCLKETFSDPRLVLLNRSADHLGHELQRRGYHRVDAVVSSLSLCFMPVERQRVLLENLRRFMDERSVYSQYQYIYGLRFENGRARRYSSLAFLSQYFDSIQCRTVWRNLPPARVFTCLGKAPQGCSSRVRPTAPPRKPGSPSQASIPEDFI
jgi:phosphatidylethanolamine/phosphatidyl-N-methylethanolamine N-methyltransferase